MIHPRKPRQTAQDGPGRIGEARVVPPDLDAATPRVGVPGPGRWTLTIWDWTPPSVNRLLSTHWAKRGRLKQEAADRVYLAAKEARVPEATGKRRVSIEVWVTHGGHRPDPDNVPKAILDGLKRCRLLVDDTAELCETPPVVVELARAKVTIIVIEDIA